MKLCQGNHKKKTRKVYIYGYNTAKYDYILLFAHLRNTYKLDIVGDYRKLMRIQIGNVTFLDFNNLFPFGLTLEKFAEEWNMPQQKGHFDHKKVNSANFR